MPKLYQQNKTETMSKDSKQLMIPDEVVISKIYVIRGEKVMLDRDLSQLYGVTTGNLNKAVKRNIKRFPEDFMFQLTKEKMQNWIFQFGTSNREKMGMRKMPLAFTEQGAGVLHSDRAIQVHVQIIRVFTRLRKMLLTSKDLLIKMEQIEKQVSGQDKKIELIFNYLKQFIKDQEKPRNKIGFKIKGK